MSKSVRESVADAMKTHAPATGANSALAAEDNPLTLDGGTEDEDTDELHTGDAGAAAGGKTAADDAEEGTAVAGAADAPVPGLVPPAGTGKAPVVGAAGKPGVTATAVDTPKFRPPASWRPEARESWKTLPIGVQQEVMRREQEITRTLAETAEARNFHRDAMQVTAPYAAILANEGATPIAAFQEMMRISGVCRTGSPQQKAKVMADAILQWNVDVELVDQLLTAGLSQRGGGAPVGGQLDPTIAALQQQVQQLTGHIQQMQQPQRAVENDMQRSNQQSIDAMAADERFEFFEDVRGDMAYIMESYAQRGQTINLQDAYSRATLLHPTISKIVEQRAAGGDSAAQAAITKAKGAAVSVTNSGAPSQASDDEDDTGAPGSVRSAVEAAFKKASLNNRRRL